MRKIAQTLRVATDSLVVEPSELEPDEDLRLQFNAISHMPEEEQRVIKQLLEGMIIKYEVECWSSRRRANG